jgi:hypothetical protein
VKIHEPLPADAATQAVAKILQRGSPTGITARAIRHVTGASTLSVIASLGLAGTGTKHRPNARLRAAEGARTVGVVKDVRDNELYFRAAYIVAASGRLNADLKRKLPLRQALAKERPFQKAHEKARRNRQEVATQIQQQQKSWGPLLGWYRDPLSEHSESECRDAHGHNFYADKGTVIGWPGAVHPHCHCKAGAPWPDGGMVDDHVRLHKVVNRTYRLKK